MVEVLLYKKYRFFLHSHICLNHDINLALLIHFSVSAVGLSALI